MIASLMMYTHPALDAAYGRYWAAIRRELAKRDISSPATLSNETDELEVWRAPDLVLSQTCGMPYRTLLFDHVTLIGTPDFGVSGCQPGYYRSALVVRHDDPRDHLAAYENARFVFNQSISQSGFAAAYNHTKPLDFWFKDRSETGSHMASARAIAENQADIAALDAISLLLMQRYEKFTERLRVLEWTAPTPGHAYIAGKGADGVKTRQAVDAAIASLDQSDLADLGLYGMVDVPKSAYLAISNPPEGTGV